MHLLVSQRSHLLENKSDTAIPRLFSLPTIHQSELNAYLLATRGGRTLLNTMYYLRYFETMQHKKYKAHFTLHYLISTTTVNGIRTKNAMACKKVTGTLFRAFAEDIGILPVYSVQ